MKFFVIAGLVLVGLFYLMRGFNNPPYHPDSDGQYQSWQLENMRLKVDSVDTRGFAASYRDTVSEGLVTSDEVARRANLDYKLVGFFQKHYWLSEFIAALITCTVTTTGFTMTTLFFTPGGGNAGYGQTHVFGGFAPMPIVGVFIMVLIWIFKIHPHHGQDVGQLAGCGIDSFFYITYKTFTFSW